MAAKPEISTLVDGDGLLSDDSSFYGPDLSGLNSCLSTY